MSKVLEFFPKNNKGFDVANYGLEVNSPVYRKGKINGLIGLELELEAASPLPARIDTAVGKVSWTPHPDGSLRGYGMEYTLSAPCKEKDVEPLLDGLFKEIADRNVKLKLSNRCSTHVHVNVTDLTINQICSFVALWACFEDVLVNWCGESRAGNLFCLRLRDAEFSVNQWVHAFKTGNFGQFSNEYKYMALNPAAFNRFGSLEFRSLRGADNPGLVIKWVDCLLRLRSKALGYEDPTTMVQDISGLGGVGFLRQILEGLPILEEVEEVNTRMGVDMNEVIFEGFRRIQPVVYALPWQVVLPEIKKPYIPDPFGRTKRAKVASGNPIRFNINPVDQAINEAFERVPQPQGLNSPFQILNEGNGRISIGGGIFNLNDRTHRDVFRRNFPQFAVDSSPLGDAWRVTSRETGERVLTVPRRVL